MNTAIFQPVTAEIAGRLAQIVGADQCSTRQADLEQHAHDQGFYATHAPEIVVWPTSAEHVSRILALVSEQHIPVTPWGAGTSIEGNPVPLYGGILLSLQRMDAIVAVH